MSACALVAARYEGVDFAFFISGAGMVAGCTKSGEAIDVAPGEASPPGDDMASRVGTSIKRIEKEFAQTCGNFYFASLV